MSDDARGLYIATVGAPPARVMAGAECAARCDNPHDPAVPEWWTEPGQRHRDEVAAALATCHVCPVRAGCLTWAMTTGRLDESSILAGTTGAARDRHRRSLASRAGRRAATS